MAISSPVSQVPQPHKRRPFSGTCIESPQLSHFTNGMMNPCDAPTYPCHFLYCACSCLVAMASRFHTVPPQPIIPGPPSLSPFAADGSLLWTFRFHKKLQSLFKPA